MSSVKVINWITIKDLSDSNYKEIIGGLGGWFDVGDTYQDYLDSHDISAHPYINALYDEIVSKDLKITGEQHQSEYIPLFNDETVGYFSFRAWGDLMAAIHQKKNNKSYHYMNFYYEWFNE